MLRTHACQLHWHRDPWGRSHAIVTGVAVPPFPFMPELQCADPDDERRPPATGRARMSP